MITINNTPILMKIISHYNKYGYQNFYIAMGYKYEFIIKYFKKNFVEIKYKNLKNKDKRYSFFYDPIKYCKFNLI